MSLKIGEVQTQSGLSIKTIRYYETRGLVRSTDRTEGGFRLFDPDVVPRLAFIRQAQALGLSLEEIGQLLAIYDGGQAPCQAVKGKLQDKLDDCDRRLSELQAFRDRLQALINQADQLAREGAEAGPNRRICPIVDRASQVQPPQDACGSISSIGSIGSIGPTCH